MRDPAHGVEDAASGGSVPLPQGFGHPGNAVSHHLIRGRYAARLGQGAADIAHAQALRARCFSLSSGDCDIHDDRCQHVLIHDVHSGALVCCYRLSFINGADDLAASYSSQFYDLSSLGTNALHLVELGRFCIEPGLRDADVLRIAWGMLGAMVDARGADMLIGCASFAGTEPGLYRDAFALLAQRHLAPSGWRPRPRAPEIFRFADLPAKPQDHKAALRQLPSLLRSYLAMGGQVSDHAVVDRQMNTLHVFTGLRVDRIPTERKRILRAVVG